jgi:MarR family transcriptional regulator, lower aerobic nicotinate degradation pathway regulator
MSTTGIEPTTRKLPLPRYPEELISSNAFLLKRLGFFAKERGMAAYEDTGLNPYHHAILVVLDQGALETQGAIADRLGYDRGQLVGMLDELEDQGLVERRRDPDDRRRHIVQMTPAGRKALGKLRAIAVQLENDLLAPLDESERQKLHDLLLRLAEHHLPGCQLGSFQQTT